MTFKVLQMLDRKLLAVCTAVVLPLSTVASEPVPLTHPATFAGAERWPMREFGGEFEVHALSDERLETDAKEAGRVPRVAAYALRKGSSVVLINAGRGRKQGSDLGQVANNLQAVGISPDEVSAVLLTSMHADQVGGLLDTDGHRQYKNAQLFASPKAMQYWLTEHSYVRAPDDEKIAFATTIKSVMPYARSGKLQAADEGSDVLSGLGIKVIAVDGAFPGCVDYLIESNGHKLLISGDEAQASAR